MSAVDPLSEDQIPEPVPAASVTMGTHRTTLSLLGTLVVPADAR